MIDPRDFTLADVEDVIDSIDEDNDAARDDHLQELMVSMYPSMRIQNS